MPKARPDQDEQVVRIIMNTYGSNPSVYTIIGKGGNQQKKLNRLAHFALIRAKNRDGVYISENEKAIAFCYRSEKTAFKLNEIWSQIRLALVIPWKNVRYGIKRELAVKKLRKQKPHLYAWFYGAENDAGQAAFELKNELFDLGRKEGRSILAETSIERNRKIYMYFGFEQYAAYDDPTGITIWFLEKKFD